jgi:hypothetical protein
MPTQSLLGCLHLYHGHLNRRALANFSRWRMPKPSRFLGLQTTSQFNLRLPLVISSVSAQRKARLILFMEARQPGGILRGIRWNLIPVSPYRKWTVTWCDIFQGFQRPLQPDPLRLRSHMSSCNTGAHGGEGPLSSPTSSTSQAAPRARVDQ